MARPKPDVLLEYVDKNYRSEQIISADAIYAILYKGRPINLKSFNSLYDGHNNAKYKKTSFSNKAHCINLAKRLNEKFKTSDFTVVKFETGGEVVYHEDWFK